MGLVGGLWGVYKNVFLGKMSVNSLKMWDSGFIGF